MIKYKIDVTPTAEGDIWEAVHYINDQLSNPVAAQRMLDMIDKQYELLESMPRIGKEYIAGNGKIYRYVFVGNYMLFYTIEDTSVLVRRFLFAPSDVAVHLVRE